MKTPLAKGQLGSPRNRNAPSGTRGNSTFKAARPTDTSTQETQRNPSSYHHPETMDETESLVLLVLWITGCTGIALSMLGAF